MPWIGWTARGGNLDGGTPVVGVNADGRLEVFASGQGADGPHLWHIWQTAPNSVGWSAWDDLGDPPPPAQFLGFPVVGSNEDGRLEAFVRVGLMSSGHVWHIWQTAPNSGWSAWDDLGAPPNGVGGHFLVLGTNADGRLECFAVNDYGVSHIWQTAPNNGWSDWGDLSEPPGAGLVTLAVGRNADGRLEAFATGSSGELWHIWQTAPNSGWSPWASLGMPAGVQLFWPAVGLDSHGHLNVFFGGQNAILYIHQDPASPTAWSAWQTLATPVAGAPPSTPVVAQQANGRLDLYSIVNGALWHLSENPAAATGWGAWQSLGGEPTSVGVGLNANGQRAVFAEANTAAAVNPLWQR
jgi:hypothetical protein